MAQLLDGWVIEAYVRALLSLRPPPLLLLVSVHEWCSMRVRPRRLYRVGERMVGRYGSGMIYPDTAWARAETESRRVCERYGCAAVSMHRALEPLVRSSAAGFGLAELVGDDCLHPTNGKRGVAYLSELLVHWLDSALASWRALRRDVPHLLPRLSRPPRSLGEPLHAANGRAAPPARCYSFMRERGGGDLELGGRAGGGISLQVNAQATRPVEWRNVGNVPGGGGAPAAAQCPRGIGSAGGQAALEAFVGSRPSGWFFCKHALGTTRKVSPGVLALVPGATMEASFDLQLAAQPGARAGSDGDARGGVTLTLEYLTSYERMGVASVRCLSGCACEAQLLDGHRTDAVRNVSTFAALTFPVRVAPARGGRAGGKRGAGAAEPCVLEFKVLAGTRSGGHKVKLRSATALWPSSTAAPATAVAY